LPKAVETFVESRNIVEFRSVQNEAKRIEDYLASDSDRMLLVDGARQIGMSYIIRHVGQKLFSNHIEINMEEDKLGDRIFAIFLYNITHLR